jgi:hypothetical protein
MINVKQIKLIWVLARQLGLDPGQVHDLIFQNTAKKSIKELSDLEIKQLIEHFIRLGAQVKKRRQPSRNLPFNVVEIVSQKQIRLVDVLVDQLGWQDDPGRLKGFFRKVIRRDRIITKQDGIKVIEGLKSILNKKRGEPFPQKPKKPSKWSAPGPPLFRAGHYGVRNLSQIKRI